MIIKNMYYAHKHIFNCEYSLFGIFKRLMLIKHFRLKHNNILKPIDTIQNSINN